MNGRLPAMPQLIEVVAVDRAAPTIAASAPTVDGRVPTRYGVTTVLVTLLAAVVMLAWWQHRSEVRLSVSERPAVRTADIDASGCPVQAECESLLGDTNEMSAAVARVFPTADVLQTGSVVTAASGKIVRTTELLRTSDGVLVTVAAQCVPGGGAVPRRRGPLKTVGPADGLLVVPGAAGCSVAVTAHSPAGIFVPIRELEELAYDPTVQLRP